MSKTDRPAKLAVEERGYQPQFVKEGYIPRPQGGTEPATNQQTSAKPPAKPPNQGSAGKK